MARTMRAVGLTRRGGRAACEGGGFCRNGVAWRGAVLGMFDEASQPFIGTGVLVA